MIKNIVFDMGNVLVKYDPPYFLRHLPKDQQKILNDAIYNSQDWRELDMGNLTESQLAVRICNRVPADLHDKVEQFIRWYELSCPIENMEQLVCDLYNKGYNIYLLSNTSHAFHQFKTSIPALKYFKGLFISADVGILKPDKHIFELFCDKFSLLPHECIFIDDSKANVDSAVKVGFSGIVFDGDAMELRDKLSALNIK